MEHREEPVRLPVLHVFMVGAGDFRAVDVAGAEPPEHPPLEGLQPAIGEAVLPASPHHPEQIEVRDRGFESQPVIDRAVAQKREVEGLPVVGDEEIVLGQDPLHLGDQGSLLRVVASEELAKDEIPISDMAEPDQEDGLRLEPARLDVEKEHPSVPEFSEQAALGRIERFDRFPERSGRGHVVVTGIGRAPDLIESLQERHRALIQIGVEPLVHEHRPLPPDHDAAGEDVFDGCGHDTRLSRAADRGIERRPRRRLLAQQIPDPLAEGGGDHRPSIRRSKVTVASLLGIGQPP